MPNRILDFSKKEKKIIKKYNKLYKFIFKYSILIILIIISIIILNKNINRSDTLDINDNFIVEKAKLIGEFNKITNQKINNSEIKIYILQGILNMSDDFIFSTNNLLSYKDIILPRNVFIHKSTPIKSKTDFENPNYEIYDLENFANNIIFTNSNEIEKDARKIISLPLKDNINDTFYLSCINNYKLINNICDYYIKNFLNTFFIYDIKKDYTSLNKIFNNLQNTKYKNDICNSMKKYVLYSNDTSKELENIFIKCGDDYYENFYTIQLFIDIQDQLNKGYINSSVYQNKLLNAYKLISYQQIIYNDINNNNINNIRFETYIYYLQELLKNTNKIEGFYLDLTYWLNNNYIITNLNKLKYQVSEKNKIEIENIIKSLNKINNGDNLIGYSGLKGEITNKNLGIITTIEEGTEISIEEQNIINKLLDNIASLSFFKIIREKIIGDKIKITGYFSIKSNDGNFPLYVSIIVKNINDRLIIDTLNFDEYKELNETLLSIIQDKQYTIPELYQYLQENINLFLSDNKISTCELIENKINNILQGNKNINELKILECNSDKISIIKNEEINKEIIKTYYKITLNNFNITNIMISDKYIENEISKIINNINTNNITIPTIIGDIILYKKEKKLYTQQGSNNIIITIEDFEKFLGIIPKDIVEGDDKIIVEFEIQGIKFIGNYNITSKKISPLNIKNNNKEELDQKDLNINNFELYLNKDNQNSINEFLINPLNYIKKIDPTIIIN